jgi:hypothetical protein
MLDTEAREKLALLYAEAFHQSTWPPIGSSR